MAEMGIPPKGCISKEMKEALSQFLSLYEDYALNMMQAAEKRWVPASGRELPTPARYWKEQMQAAGNIRDLVLETADCER